MNWIESVRRDVRHAWRMIARMPVLATVVVLSLGVGIGVNVVIFSWIQAVVFQPIPGVAGAASFHLVEPRTETGMNPGTSWPEYRDLRERLHTFRDLLAFRMTAVYVGEPGQVERAYGLLVSGNYFSALGLRPAFGRFFRPDEVSQPGGEPVVVISHRYWQSHFAGAPTAVGQVVRVNSRNLTIVGVAPRGFQGTVLRLKFDLWLPATMAPVLLNGSRELDQRNVRGYTATGLLRPGTTRAQAQSDVDAAMRQLSQEYPDTNATMQGEVLPFWQFSRGPQRFLVTALAFLQAIMLLLLVAVCGNTANLMLARASARQREMGMRLALGAGPWRIVSLLLAENMMLALIGAGLGVAIGVWGTRALAAMPLTIGFPINFETHVDMAGLVFAVALGILCGAIFGAAPAFQLARLDPQLAFRAGSAPGGRSRLRNALMAIQVTLALVVLVAAGLFLRSFLETRATDPGFRREGVLLAAYDLTGRRYRQWVRPSVRRSAPGAAPRAAIGRGRRRSPLQCRSTSTVCRRACSRLTAGCAPRPDSIRRCANTVTPGYFAVMGIPLVAGKDLRGTRRCHSAATGHRERGLRATVPGPPRAPRPPPAGARPVVRDCRCRAQLAVQRLRRGADADHRFRTRQSDAGRGDSPAHAGGQRYRQWRRPSVAPCASSIPSCPSTTSERSPRTSRPTCCFAAFPRGCSPCSAPCFWSLAAIGIYAVVATPCRSARPRSACVSRSGATPEASLRSSCARACS